MKSGHRKMTCSLSLSPKIVCKPNGTDHRRAEPSFSLPTPPAAGSSSPADGLYCGRESLAHRFPEKGPRCPMTPDPFQDGNKLFFSSNMEVLQCPPLMLLPSPFPLSSQPLLSLCSFYTSFHSNHLQSIPDCEENPS